MKNKRVVFGILNYNVWVVIINLKYETLTEILVTVIPLGVPSLPAGEHTDCGDLSGKDAAFLNVEESPS